MKIAIDGTPAATQFAGVGRYTRELLRALVQLDVTDQFQVLCSASVDQVATLESLLPPGAWREFHRTGLPERITTAGWQRLRLPVPVDLFLNEFDVFHGPDFVLPPTRQASVVTIHDLSYLIAPNLGEPSLVAFLRQAVPRALRRADQIITVSASVAAELIDVFPQHRHKVNAIPNGVALPVRGEARQDAGVLPTILIVGTIEPRKNHLTLLDALPYVWSDLPEARIVIAGRVGWQSDQIMERLKAAASDERVVFVEQPDDAKLAELFEKATVFAYPSMYEGFGLPILEAMSWQVPVVASDITALRETAGDAAMFAAPLDAEALGHAIIKVFNDQALRHELVEAGLQRVAMHSWSETASRTRRTYLAAMEGHHQ